MDKWATRTRRSCNPMMLTIAAAACTSGGGGGGPGSLPFVDAGAGADARCECPDGAGGGEAEAEAESESESESESEGEACVAGGGGGLALQVVAEGLEAPVHVTAPRGDDRLFVVEQTGRVRIVRDGALLPEPFLDLTDRAFPFEVGSYDERGALGLAFHPRYAENGRFFVNYIDRSADPGDTRISEFRVSDDPDRADRDGERVLLTIDQPYWNHNGGMLAFGPDGYLYVGVGDGGSGCDPGDRAQDLSDLLGKILRLDVDAGPPYLPGSPPNPFAGRDGARPEIWAYGLRNPWRFSFDRDTGDLYIADVGQSAAEEIDFQAAGSAGGENYGWRDREGTACSSDASGCRAACDVTGVAPVLEYSHADGCSISGGAVYRGACMPSQRGRYFYSDYCGGWLRSFRVEGGAAVDAREDLRTGEPISAIGEDARGEVYVVHYQSGRISRIVPGP